MTLDEAIKHCKEVSKKHRSLYAENPKQLGYVEKFFDCIKCAEEHEQLAEWLEELKILRESKNWKKELEGISNLLQLEVE